MAVPVTDFLRKKPTAAMTSRAIPMTHSAWGVMVAPWNASDSSPENAARPLGNLPQIIITRPLIMMASPMVTMIRFRTSGLRLRPSVIFSANRPINVTAMTANVNAAGTGQPKLAATAAAVMPPSMTNSPWAKLMTPLVLYTMQKPTATRP